MRALSTALSGLYDTIMPQDQSARFTVGSLRLSPGSVNAIPEDVRCTVDIRHPDPESLDALEAKIAAAFSKEAGKQGCTAAIRRLFDMAPCVFDEGLQDSLEAAASSLQLSSKRMLSGAFHDALFANRVAPAAMIFVPCRDGLSHNEAEFVEPAHATAGCETLAHAVLEITKSSKR
jgi:N-carbamoyl-L-amino-acid hydrolase